MNSFYQCYYNSPLGKLTLLANENELVALSFNELEKEQAIFNNKVLIATKHELDEYFKGTLIKFTIPLNTKGTEFQLNVWKELKNIPFGETISYLSLSKKIGNEKAIRAVGTANGKNPIPIIIPCHRVIGNNGNLVGFSGGLERKRWLLTHEAKFSGKSLF